MSNLKDIINSVIEKHREIYATNPRAEICPSVIAFSGDEGHVFQIPWRNEEKFEILFNLKLLFKLMNIDSYVVCSEAWAASARSLSELKRPVRDREDRMEVIIASGASIDGKKISVSHEIVRDWDGNVTELKLCSEQDDSNCEMAGNLLELLD